MTFICKCHGREFKFPWNIASHLKNSGPNNKSWKGDKVSYRTLHNYIVRHLSKQKFCTNCKIETSRLDCANISGKYLRDLSDWKWLCRKCHMIEDGRMDLLTPFKKGHIPWFKGKKMSEKAKNRMSISAKIRYSRSKHPRLGVHLSEETKRKISETKRRGRQNVI